MTLAMTCTKEPGISRSSTKISLNCSGVRFFSVRLDQNGRVKMSSKHKMSSGKYKILYQYHSLKRGGGDLF